MSGRPEVPSVMSQRGGWWACDLPALPPTERSPRTSSPPPSWRWLESIHLQHKKNKNKKAQTLTFQKLYVVFFFFVFFKCNTTFKAINTVMRGKTFLDTSAIHFNAVALQCSYVHIFVRLCSQQELFKHKIKFSGKYFMQQLSENFNGVQKLPPTPFLTTAKPCWTLPWYPLLVKTEERFWKALPILWYSFGSAV